MGSVLGAARGPCAWRCRPHWSRTRGCSRSGWGSVGAGRGSAPRDPGPLFQGRGHPPPPHLPQAAGVAGPGAWVTWCRGPGNLQGPIQRPHHHRRTVGPEAAFLGWPCSGVTWPYLMKGTTCLPPRPSVLSLLLWRGCWGPDKAIRPPYRYQHPPPALCLGASLRPGSHRCTHYVSPHPPSAPRPWGLGLCPTRGSVCEEAPGGRVLRVRLGPDAARPCGQQRS